LLTQSTKVFRIPLMFGDDIFSKKVSLMAMRVSLMPWNA